MENSLQKKTILVTGGAGFIGSHLVERLVKDGHKVISLDNYFTGSKDNHIAGAEYREGHTKDIATHIPEALDIIYHLGEYSRVEQSILEPDIVYDLNALGTQAVVAFWKTRRCKLVYAGSSTKFGDGGATRHTSPYARTKAENSELVRDVGEREGLSYAITYFYNVYGPRERSGVYGTVIEHFKRMYLSGTPCAVVAPGTQVRNFTHALDIIDALLLVGDKGEGDEYGLGNEQAYSVLEVANMFGFDEEEIVMFPERRGNRMSSGIDTTKTRALGWRASRSLSEYIQTFTETNLRGEKREKRVLVFSTTMHPTSGLAEDAFVDLVCALPGVQFDVVTTRFVKNVDSLPSPASNITLYRLGVGGFVDKFFLPVGGLFVGRKLASSHAYLFAWSLMASYATIAAALFKRMRRTPLLVTLADHNIGDIQPIYRFFLRLVISNADQVYGTHSTQEADAVHVFGKTLPRNSLGEGDAFANALRYAYADMVMRRQEKNDHA